MSKPTRGRPRGITINGQAVEDILRLRCMSKAELCDAAPVSSSQLAGMIHHAKGVREETVRAMATVLDVAPGTIAPELSTRFLAVRPGDAYIVGGGQADDDPAEMPS